MKVVLILLAAFIIGTLMIIFGLYISSYIDERYTSGIPIKFSTWKKYYDIAPRKWDIYKRSPGVKYCTDQYKDVVYVNISFWTYWQFWLWRWWNDVNEKDRECAKKYEKLLGYIQEDVDFAIKDAQDEIDRAIKESAKHIEALTKEGRAS